MARPLRIEYPGAYYHVKNRGNRRDDIFLTDKDRKVFLDKQKEIGAIFGVDYSTVSQSRARLKTKLKSGRKLKKQFHRLLEQIDKLSN
jgi:N12 class adenine-specific DNA methylase